MRRTKTLDLSWAFPSSKLKKWTSQSSVLLLATPQDVEKELSMENVDLSFKLFLMNAIVSVALFLILSLNETDSYEKLCVKEGD